jgi:hypothetical protein
MIIHEIPSTPEEADAKLAEIHADGQRNLMEEAYRGMLAMACLNKAEQAAVKAWAKNGRSNHVQRERLVAEYKSDLLACYRRSRAANCPVPAST